jgi:hypothetical protein
MIKFNYRFFLITTEAKKFWSTKINNDHKIDMRVIHNIVK